MKIKNAVSVVGISVLFLGAGLQAADMSAIQSTNTTLNLLDANSDEIYRNMELNVQAFGMGTVNDHGNNPFNGNRYGRHVQVGLGAGLEFFFMKYIGVEAEGFSTSTHGSFVNDFGGNLVLRLPIGQTGLAPYIFGGGGHEWEPSETGYGDGGAGLEFRFTPWIGIFADARYVATVHDNNYGMGRLGVDFSF